MMMDADEWVDRVAVATNSDEGMDRVAVVTNSDEGGGPGGGSDGL
jgi:hypothetical protein